MWSTYIQGIETLYRSRNTRFRHEKKEQYLKAMGLQDGMQVLEIGCGPGLLCHRMAEWLPNSKITGLDRDENFVAYAKAKTMELDLPCTFVQGDAEALAFPDNTFDACTSHTVMEHIPTRPFLAEQYRVCRPDGVVSVLSSRMEAAINPESWLPVSGEEKELWDRNEEAAKACNKENKICAYPLTVSEIPRYMEEAGFVGVNVDFIAVPSVPDNAQAGLEFREELIESSRHTALDAILLARNYAPGIWSEGETDRLRKLVNQRFDERIKALHEGRKVWDIGVSMLMVARGYKPEEGRSIE